ncbi:Transcriptional regulator, IclR family [Candidatus Burkholderia verschuerenii]|uniref:Transcriptional regulator, IclR family n=1 Tax=Candidatus Burkholderia verschuerenii TaxID=242163 RepID=A0A0L0MHQ7_9BURK|nr:IclR family transcriptional regulator [Candidatus Burkholderia verschuerenii]KND61858.1 Transcriptional regulator, IclR family [Candidatus Burkholderia verschuerenii]
MDKSYEVPALRRTNDILDLLATAAKPVRAATLAERTGLSRSTLYLLLDTLTRLQWIDKRDDGYMIGVGLFELGNAYKRHDQLQAAFRKGAGEFIAKHNEVVQLAVLDGVHVVYVAREDPHRPVRLVSDLGSRLPAHCCALGKALLAGLSDDAVIERLPERLEAVTPHTVTRRAALLRELAVIRTSGLAIEREEVAAGIACFAAYVGMTPAGKRVAVSASVPVGRLDAKREKLICIGVVQLAGQLRGAL